MGGAGPQQQQEPPDQPAAAQCPFQEVHFDVRAAQLPASAAGQPGSQPAPGAVAAAAKPEGARFKFLGRGPATAGPDLFERCMRRSQRHKAPSASSEGEDVRATHAALGMRAVGTVLQQRLAITAPKEGFWKLVSGSCSAYVLKIVSRYKPERACCAYLVYCI